MRQVVSGNGNIVVGGNIFISCSEGITSGGMSGGIIGSGKVKAERRTVERINKIVVTSLANVLFTRGASPFLRVTADDNILPFVETTIMDDGSLNVECKGSFSTKTEILVEVEMPSLEQLVTRGSGNVQLNDIEQPSLHVELIGSGDIMIVGKVDHFEAELNGSGDIKALGLKAQAARLTLNGSGYIRAYASNSVRARLYGSGYIQINGNPKQQDCSVTGTGDIDFV